MTTSNSWFLEAAATTTSTACRPIWGTGARTSEPTIIPSAVGIAPRKSPTKNPDLSEPRRTDEDSTQALFSAFGRSLGSYGLHGLSGSAGAAAIIGAGALAAGLCFGGFGGLAVAHTVVTGVAVSSDVMVGVLTATLGICFSVAQTC